MTSQTSRTPGHDLPTPEGRLSKPTEIDELIDLHFHRPLARRVVRILAQTPATPNQVTVFAGLLGVLAGAVLWIYGTDPTMRLWAALLLLFSAILDCADGQLARLKNISSTTGAILDGISDYFVGFAIFLGTMHAAAEMTQNAWIWWLGSFAGISTVLQCGLYDQVKLRYVRAVGLAYQEREEDLDRVAYQRMQARQHGDYKTLLLLWVYEKYTLAQRAALTEPVAEDPDAFRQKNRLKMRAWTLIGIGTHLLCFYLTIALSYIWPAALLASFFIFATLMNVILVYLWTHDWRRE
jgi:phosphatidylglycerophosphate synthase